MFDLLLLENFLTYADCVHEICQQMNVYCSCEEILVRSSLSPEADLQHSDHLGQFYESSLGCHSSQLGRFRTYLPRDSMAPITRGLPNGIRGLIRRIDRGDPNDRFGVNIRNTSANPWIKPRMYADGVIC